MQKQYQVIGQCAHVRVMTPSGWQTRMLMKGALLPEGVPQDRIDHLLSVKLIKEVGEWPAVATPAPVLESGADETSDPAAQELAEKRAVARAKLPADGSLPDGRSGQAVWVEFLAGKGYDYDALKDQDRADLVELAKNAT